RMPPRLSPAPRSSDLRGRPVYLRPRSASLCSTVAWAAKPRLRVARSPPAFWYTRQGPGRRLPEPEALPSGAGEGAPESGTSGWRPGDTSTRCGRVALEHSRQHLLGKVGKGLLLLDQVAVPRSRVPDLDSGVCADHNAVLGEAGVFTQLWRDRHAPLFVRHLVRGTGEQHPLIVAGGLAGDWCRTQLVGHPLELCDRPHVEAAFLPLGYH